jgi:hypothetical protein
MFGYLYAFAVMEWKDTIALLAVLVTVTGWFVTQYLNRQKEDRTRRLESLLKHYQKQIEEFYGPLFNLVHQIFLVNHTLFAILTAKNKDGTPCLTEEQGGKISNYFLEKHFAKLHEEINEILKAKLYLVEGSELPESFYDYMRHAYQERDQRAIYTDLGIGTSFVLGVPWPEQFYADIKSGFGNAMRKYEDCLSGLKNR